MDTFEAITTRRSVKHYDPEHRMSEEEITKLISNAMLSPTSYNIQNWRFVVLTDAETRQKVRAAAWDQAQVTDSSILIAVCADLKAWAREPGRYWKDAPTEVQEFLVPMIGQFYEGNDQLSRDEAMRSVGLASQTIMLAARAMGYDSCPMIGFDPAQVAEIIKLPDDHVIGMLISVGKPIKEANARGGQLPIEDVLFRDTF